MQVNWFAIYCIFALLLNSARCRIAEDPVICQLLLSYKSVLSRLMQCIIYTHTVWWQQTNRDTGLDVCAPSVGMDIQRRGMALFEHKQVSKFRLAKLFISVPGLLWLIACNLFDHGTLSIIAALNKICTNKIWFLSWNATRRILLKSNSIHICELWS